MRILQHFLLWLLKLTGWRAPAPVPAFVLPERVTALLPRAKELTAACFGWDASGEAKRHRVYAQMIKEFPAAAHKDIGLAIELVMQDAG